MKHITLAVLAATCIALGAYCLKLKRTLDDFQSVAVKRFDCSKPSEDPLVSLWCQINKQYETSPLAGLAGKDEPVSRDEYINGWVSIVQRQLLSPENPGQSQQPGASWLAGQRQAHKAFQQYLDNTIAKTIITPLQQSASSTLSLFIKEAYEQARLDNASPIGEVQFTFGYLIGRLAAFEQPQRLDILASPATTVDTLKAMSDKEAQKIQTDAMTKSFAEGLEAGIYDTMIQLQRTIKPGLQSLASTPLSSHP